MEPKAPANTTPAEGRATPRQLEAIGKLAKAKGLDAAAVEPLSLRVLNRKPEALRQAEAARLIKEPSNLRRSAA